jgi:MoaA/NifB/PqqE/SkfB family radical SAM enzyme
MRYLTIRGKRKRIPPYPHHKNYVYRASLFFEANHLAGWFLVNGLGNALRRMWFQRKYRFSVPISLLIDPTSACNLKCRGCWAADYGKKDELSFEELDSIFSEAKKLGINDIVMSGGEPLMRKDDILRLCQKHNRLTFALYTNGTLIDAAFADELARIGNLIVFISIEGFRENTDFRRGKGTFDNVVAAMDLLKERDIGFGFSICYHARNYEEVSSEEFLDFLTEKGAWMGWMFIYMPIGSNADASLCLSGEQRRYVKDRIEAFRKKNRFTIIDFANLGHKAFGCVAAANEFAHINAHGDMEPCAFYHYSDTNIHGKSLTEALASPFFRHFRKHKPFSQNPYRPCPIMDVPENLASLNHFEGVRSTHLHHPEDHEQLYWKTSPLANGWKPIAEKMYHDMPEKEKRKFRLLSRFIIYRH